MPRVRIVSLLCVCGLLAPGSPAAVGATGPPSESRIQESVLVRRVHRPVFIEPRRSRSKNAEICAALTPDDLVITEDGAPVTITAIDDTLRPTLHAVLIDTSYSMNTRGRHHRTRIERAKEAARRYVEELPAGEPVIVASFDDNLLLHTPPTTDRHRLAGAVERLSVGNNTALWDALYYLVRYVESYPGHKVVVLLSDGEDSVSLKHHAFDEILRLASTTSDLTVFPIGLDLPRRSGLTGPDRRARLGALARATGGELYEVRRTALLSDAFNRIRTRLEGKHFVTYIPEPFGQGVLDEPERYGHRFRRVEVGVRPHVPCRVISLAPPLRLEGRIEPAGGPPSPVAPADAAAWLDRLDPACFDPSTHRPSEGLRIPLRSPDPRGPAVEAYLLDPPDGIVGRVPDLKVERGVLYDAASWDRHERLRLRMDRKPAFETRAFTVEVPPLDVVRERLRAPEDVLLHLLRRPPCPGPAGDAGPHGEPWWIHGQTFLEAREGLGLALFGFFPEYRAWASGRLRDDGAPEVAALLDAMKKARDATEDEIRRAARALEAMAESPAGDQPQRYLAEWLGDVRALDLAHAIETRAGDALLAAGAGSLPETTRSVLEGWERLRAWMPPPTRVRIVTPLLPAWDPDRDVIGFFRIVLPRPRVGLPPDDLLPAEPFGLLMLRWLLADPDVERAAAAGVRLASLDHGPVEPGVWRGVVGLGEGDQATSRRPLPSREVRLALADPQAPGRVYVTAWVPGSRRLLEPEGDDPGGPFCARVRRDPVVSETLAGLHDALSDSLGRRDRACAGPE